jgi:hypothetical protein
MPSYPISVTSDDNMTLAKAASENSQTVEQYLARIVKIHCDKLRGES